jgi:hypothetical protein
MNTKRERKIYSSVVLYSCSPRDNGDQKSAIQKKKLTKIMIVFAYSYVESTWSSCQKRVKTMENFLSEAEGPHCFIFEKLNLSYKTFYQVLKYTLWQFWLSKFHWIGKMWHYIKYPGQVEQTFLAHCIKQQHQYMSPNDTPIPGLSCYF